jgi:hypothetical protein
VSTDQELFLSSCGRYIEQAFEFGLVHRDLTQRRQSVVRWACFIFPVLEGEGHSPCRLNDNSLSPSPASVRGVGDDDDGELEPLGLVDSHQLHGSAGLDRSFAFAGGSVAQSTDIFCELGDTHHATEVGVGQELVYVAAKAVATGRQAQDSTIVGRVKQFLEHLGHWHPTYQPAQLDERPAGKGGPYCITFVQV